MSCAEKKDNDLEYWSIGGSADLDYDPAALFNKNFTFDFKTISIPWTEHEKKILTSIKKVNSGQGVIVATDMFGGTPSNLAISTLKENQTEVIAGVNLPMLIKMVSSRKDLKLSELIKVSQDSGRKYINVASAFFGESKS